MQGTVRGPGDTAVRKTDTGKSNANRIIIATAIN